MLFLGFERVILKVITVESGKYESQREAIVCC